MSGHMFDTVDDLVLFVTEDNVAVFSHDLHNQIFGTQITEFIQMFNSKTDDPLHTRLFDGDDLATSDMLS